MGERAGVTDAPGAVIERTSDIDALLDLPSQLGGRAPDRIDGVVVGTLVALDSSQRPLVVYPGQPGTAALVARPAIELASRHVGEPVLLAFERGDPARPFVTGRLGTPAPSAPSRSAQVDVEADGERVTVSAGTELVLRCGKASITLTSAGKVLIEGAYVSSRSSGVLRLKGGSIQLN